MEKKKFEEKKISPPHFCPSWIRYPGWKKSGSGINVSDPQHCFSLILTTLTIITLTGSTASFPCVEDAAVEKPTTVNIFFWIHRYPKIRTYGPGSS
jgi:hypothetical protein